MYSKHVIKLVRATFSTAILIGGWSITPLMSSEFVEEEEALDYVHHYVLITCYQRITGLSIEAIGQRTEKTRIMFLGYSSIDEFMRRYNASRHIIEPAEKKQAKLKGFGSANEYRDYICSSLKERLERN